MKKLLLSSVAFGLGAISIASASLLSDAIQRGYDQGLTRYSTSSEFRAYDSLRRDEASKFFVQFTDTQGYHTNAGGNCSFSDEYSAISDLRSYVRTACEYGILNGANGKFYPDQKLTNAQAVAVVVRILDGKQSESGAHRADNYYTRARNLGLDVSNFYDKDAATTRGDVITLLYAASTNTGESWTINCNSVSQCLNELTKILNE